MGAVKDLVDLVTQLSNSIEDRKFAAELREIQSMIGGIQSEHAAMHEQRIEVRLHPQSGWPQEAPSKGALTLGKPRWG